MTEPMKLGLPLDKLGLPPMELAESSNERGSRFLYKCFYPTLQKILILMFIVTFSAGVYVLLIKMLENTDTNSRGTEIIIVTGLKDSSNVTLHDTDMHIIFKIMNKTSDARRRRRKRSIHDLDHLNANDYQKAKEIILQHRALCHETQREQICQTLIKKLQSIIDQSDNDLNQNKKPEATNNMNIGEHSDRLKNSADVTKREAQSVFSMRGAINNMRGAGNGLTPVVPVEMHQVNAVPQISEACLLAKLLRHRYPHVHGIYDAPAPEFEEHQSEHMSSPQMRYFQPHAHSYSKNREIEAPNQKLHPQDVMILMSFLTPKPDSEIKPAEANITSRSVDCASGTLPCDASDICIDENQWCDGNVDCADASDEVRCSCKSRVDESRYCDGYFDCPFGEDEMGCFGCSENTFSCDDIHHSQSSINRVCYTKEQRCNAVEDCPNRKDEIECNMLAPSLLKKPLFAVSNIEGYLHRNFKGDWHAVCQNPYMWAHDACRRETGLMIRPPFIQILPIDPMLKVNYLNAGPGGSIIQSDTCFNSSAVYVTCPDFLCGTRISTTSQMFSKNIAAENNIFGRNKRFLYPRLYDPYRMAYYGNRMKRDTSADIDATIEDIDDPKAEERNKRAESRVVGGKASQPSDWPWMVAVYRNGMFHCGGVVLTQSWVISAAHCVSKFWDHYYEVQVGMLRRFSFSPQEQIHRVTHVIVNQHYSQLDMKDDLSLMRVEPAIQFSRWVRPICLPGPNTAGADWLWGPPPDTICTAVGWGAIMEHGPDPDHMREVEVPIWENCKHREDRAGKEICAGFREGGKDACQGDSGGPLLCRNPLNPQQWYLAGIVSHGDGCGRKDEPGVYTRVSLFVKWIRYHTSSINLPHLQPIQECPGFKCKSGIPKCIPISRKCDKTVDCLDADDEINCDFTNMRSDNNLKMEENKNTDENKSSEKRESIISPSASTDNHRSITENSTNVNSIKQVTNKVNEVPTTDIKKTNKFIENTDEDTQDFSHTSTIKIPHSSSSKQFESDSNESETEDPITTHSVDITTRGDTESFPVTFESNKLESESSVLANTQHEIRRTDIEEDLEITTTATQINNFDSQLQNSDFSSQTFFDELPHNEHETTTEPESNKQHETIKSKSDKLVIELLPNLENSSHVDINSESSVHLKDQVASETNSELAKKLPDLESKDNVIDKIEDIVFSELQPASIRKKHRLPKEFECRRIYQIISHSQRCDQRADCEDGTDELDCTCSDYLSIYDQSLICDGIFDCSDGQDETDCFSCPDQHFLCQRSEICLPNKYVCDGKAQCPLGEDELNCFALSNGKEMFYDIAEKPKINLEGYLTRRIKDDWQVVCEDNLSVEQQEQSATHICHYLGFSAANRYSVKYINVKEEDIIRFKTEDKRTRRNSERKPVHFAYRKAIEGNETARNIVIKEPQLLKEECVPNVTRTCKSLYVYCDRSLYTNFDVSQNLIYNKAATESPQDVTTHMWPWVAKVFVEGYYKCTGVIVDSSWVLVSNSCLWDSSPSNNFVSVIVGSHRTLNSVGSFEKSHKVDAKKELYRSRAILLHLKDPVVYSNNVKPMVVSLASFHEDKDTICVAVGQDNKNNTISVFLDERTKDCNLSNRCFIRKGKETICPVGESSGRHWAGLISCHNEQGWYPVASFVDSRGECGLGEIIVATNIENLRQELRHYSAKPVHLENAELADFDDCEGVRCSRGRCVPVKEMCDGVTNCEDGNDETDESCGIKKSICEINPYHKGCECTLGQMKCKNGKCISKELFKNGEDDCGDGTDEPVQSSCSEYLARVMPSWLCDGIIHCQDRSDENPVYCRCFAKRIFKCGSTSNGVENCVAPDMVCDGVRDCPNGEDEQTCIGLSALEGTSYGKGQVMVQSHGVWHSKCYPSPNHTKSELEAICRELGFLSGHAKEIKEMKHTVFNTPNTLALESFNDVILNNHTVIRMRNADTPIARAIFSETLESCYPVFIECM